MNLSPDLDIEKLSTTSETQEILSEANYFLVQCIYFAKHSRWSKEVVIFQLDFREEIVDYSDYKV